MFLFPSFFSDLLHEIDHALNLGSYTLMFDRVSHEDFVAITSLCSELLNELDLATFQAGMGKGYLDRPCMDPLDTEGPKESPNDETRRQVRASSR